MARPETRTVSAAQVKSARRAADKGPSNRIIVFPLLTSQESLKKTLTRIPLLIYSPLENFEIPARGGEINGQEESPQKSKTRHKGEEDEKACRPKESCQTSDRSKAREACRTAIRLCVMRSRGSGHQGWIGNQPPLVLRPADDTPVTGISSNRTSSV